MKILLIFIFLFVDVFSQTCAEMNSNYIKHLNNFILLARQDLKHDMHKKSLIGMVKSYQEDLLKDCKGIINLDDIKKDEETVNYFYADYFGDKKLN